MKRSYYTYKIFVSFALLFLVFCIAVVWIQRTGERRDREAVIHRQLDTYADGIARYYEIHGDSLDPVKVLYPDYLRITLIERNGTVRYDSKAKDQSSMENHLLRTEVQQALLQGTGSAMRKSTTIGEDLYYYAKGYSQGNYFIRLSIPYRDQYRGFTAPDNFFLFIVGGLFLLSLLLIILFTDRFHRNVVALRRFVSVTNDNKGEYKDISFPPGELGDIGREITRTFKILSESRERVRREREKMIEHFALSDEGIVFFSKKQEFIYANSHFMQLINAITDEPTFVIDGRILETKEFRTAKDFIQAAERKSPVFKYTLDRAGGHYSVTVHIFPDQSFEIILTNITHQEEERRLKHEMTGNIAHELRTPISCVRGYVETILEAKPPLSEEKQHLFLSRAYEQLIRLSTLISDIAQLTKLEEAPSLYPKESIQFDLIVQEVVIDMAGLLQREQVVFTNHIDSPIELLGNKSLLSGIIRNLVENSIRYAGTGRQIDLYLSNQDTSHYYFSFSDNGPGVPDDALNKLFDRFYRTDEGRARAVGGSGLGLSIVKNSIRFHNGSIMAKRRAGGGLEIVFSLAK